MKFLRKIFDNVEHTIESKPKIKKFWPLTDSFDTLMFTPNKVTKSGSHIRDAIDLKRTMMIVIMALGPCLLFGMYNTGYQSLLVSGHWDASIWDCFSKGALLVLPLIIVSYGVGLGVEFIFAIRNQHAVAEGFLVSGMLIPLIMPIDTPLWMVAAATAFAVLIGKEVFGGTGMNIMNVALTARAFLFFAYPTKMSGDKVWIAGYEEMKGSGELVDGMSGATPMGELASTWEMTDPAQLEGVTNQFATGGAFDLSHSFLGLIPGSVGETSALACLIGAGLLLMTGIANWKVMASFFAGGIAMAGLLFCIGGNPYFDLDPFHQLCIGGFMFGMVFMITDPVTACQTSTGKFIYGFLGGVLAILIRILNPAYPEGVMLAILIANVCAPLIDHMVVQSNVKRRLSRVKTA
ncbi:MAG: Na+-transporting NADH:ubiquinone oxidoreductase subunit B [Parvicellaceae bacterium]|jgi:Na+-transporting NADH:ubiquinone oxidoreductase subunit B